MLREVCICGMYFPLHLLRVYAITWFDLTGTPKLSMCTSPGSPGCLKTLITTLKGTQPTSNSSIVVVDVVVGLHVL